MTDPYLNLFRRVLPPVRLGPGALDLSPIVATFVLIIVGSIVVRLIERVTVGRPAARLVATAGVVVAVDQATKQLAATRIAPGDRSRGPRPRPDATSQHGRRLRRARRAAACRGGR